MVTGLDPVASGDGPAERWRRLAVAAVAGVAMHLAFPRPGWDLLGWVALAPVLALAATARTPRARVPRGLGGGPRVLPPAAALAHPHDDDLLHDADAGRGARRSSRWRRTSRLFWGGVAWAVAWLGRRLGPGALWLAPALWVTGELARTYLLSGFPWGLLGYVPSRRLLVIQIAAWTGVYGVSALLVLVNTALAWAAVERRGRATAAALVVAGGGGGRRAPGGASPPRPGRRADGAGRRGAGEHPAGREVGRGVQGGDPVASTAS